MLLGKNLVAGVFAFGITAISMEANAVVIGAGDVFQQSSSSSWTVGDLHLLSGGTIAGRSDGRTTWFLSGPYDISGGLVDTQLLLDNTLSAQISGGTFNKQLAIDRVHNAQISGGIYKEQLTIDRLQDGGVLDISAGSFLGGLELSRSRGDITIRGGDFGSLSLWQSFGSTTFIGKDWSLNGALLELGAQDITGLTGLLIGTLEDGNAFSMFLGDTVGDGSLSVVNSVTPIPLPGAFMLFGTGLAVLGFFGWRRRDRLGSFETG